MKCTSVVLCLVVRFSW